MIYDTETNPRVPWFSQRSLMLTAKERQCENFLDFPYSLPFKRFLRNI